jgi:hypothetical protein
MKSRNGLLLLTLSIVLTACGGGGDGGGGVPSAATSTGTFIDTPVQGVMVQSGNLQGETSATGSFQYIPGQPTSFFVGALNLGTVGNLPANAFVTPLNLTQTPNPTLNTSGVVNRLMLLQALDGDGDPTNGIVIPAQTLQAAGTWPPVDFDNIPPADLQVMLPPAIANNLPSPLPTPATATSNFSDGMACAASGFYAGTFSGTDTGPWVVVSDPTDNRLAGAGFSTNDQSTFFLSGTFAPTAENNILLGVVSTGASFAGAVSNVGVSGTWNNLPTDSGTFGGNKMVLPVPAGAQGTIYRGVYLGTEFTSTPPTDTGDLGPFVVVINGQTLVGSGYSGSDEAPLTLTGSVAGNLVTGEVFENGTKVADFTGTVGANGKLLGSFTTVIGLGGTGSFNACRTTS